MYINAYNREQGPAATGSVSNHQLAGGCTKLPEEAPKEPQGFWSLKEVEAVEFTFKKSVEGLASVQVTSPGVNMQKHRSKGEMCYNCGGLDHHAKECNLSPQSKKCHFCYSTNHMVASYLLKAQQAPSSQEKQAYFQEEEEEIHSPARLPEAQK
ncbi:hypothetical protein FD755_001940 [Muntiacus reevesi]|uniref:CCHC-type domain-containing protein n=1 Tax=Muntiacus reevesi TaxID=9886 RepID=A0A5J5N4Q6_MUNRE|nr:hypothetical protein FD755_001940 [Muntiacus reevesi]